MELFHGLIQTILLLSFSGGLIAIIVDE